MTTTFRAGRLVATGVALVLTVGLSACGGDGDSTGAGTTKASAKSTADDAKPAATGELTYVGPIDGTDAQIAVTTNSGKVFAFFCDSKQAWGVLEGTVGGSKITATEPGGDTLAADVNGDTVTGTVSLNGDPHDFTATKATGDAGSYFAETKDGDQVSYTGWVRSADGNVDGARFNIDLSVLAKLPQFSSSEKTLIQQITSTGVIALPPEQANVPPNAQPLSLRGAIRCGLAGFKFKRAQSALSANETAATVGAFGDAIGGLESACGIDIPNW
jgi:hypothetical protein